MRLAQRFRVVRLTDHGDRRVIPAGVYDPQVIAFETDWQGPEEVENKFPRVLVGRRFGTVATRWIILEPPVLGLVVIEQQVQFMIAQDALRPPGFDQPGHEPHDPRTVGPAIGQVADKHEPTSVGMIAIPVVPAHLEQAQQPTALPMHITDDVQGAFEQGLLSPATISPLPINSPHSPTSVGTSARDSTSCAPPRSSWRSRPRTGT